MTPAQPRVSVVVATYGRPDRVVGAVQSVLAQTETNLELLVVDDNPPESMARRATVAALAEIGDSRLEHVLRKAPGGGAAARNSGIAWARSQWVAFLDDDDLWDSNKLEEQLRLADVNPEVDLIYSGYRAVNDRGVLVRTVVPPYVGAEYPALLAANVIGTTSSVVCRKHVLEEIGGFDEELAAAQDRDLYIRVCAKHRATAITAPLVTFRLHEDARITRDRAGKVRAYTHLLQKYAGAYRRYPREAAVMLRDLGQLRWLSGDARAARHDLRRSLRLRPVAGRTCGLWALTWIPAKAYLDLYRAMAPQRVADHGTDLQEPS